MSKIDREELNDELSDALSDRCDMDVSWSSYADAAIDKLVELGIVSFELSKGAVHDRIAEQVALAKTYAEDGAFCTAAGIFRKLADRIDLHVQETCPGHVASKNDPKVCAACGIHIDELR